MPQRMLTELNLLNYNNCLSNLIITGSSKREALDK